MSLAALLVGGGCEAPDDESLAGLAVVSHGPLAVTNARGEPEPIDGPPGDVRVVTAASGAIAAETVEREFFVSSAPGSGKTRAWRPVSLDGASGRTPSGMDLSPDGRVLAIVLGGPDVVELELATVDVETGDAAIRVIDLMSNGPPSWLAPDLLALEVIRPDQHSGIATINTTTGDVTVTAAQGYAPSATRDGARIAVVDATSGVVTIRDSADWLAGLPTDEPGIPAPAESTFQDLALDANGTRLAVAYAASSGVSWSVVTLRLAGTAWQSVSSIPVRGDTAVSIDWLD